MIRCIVHWLPRLAASSKEASNGTALVVCCKTFLVVVSRYVEPLQMYSAQGNDPEWVESEVGGVTVSTPGTTAEYGVGDTSTGNKTPRAVREPALDNDLYHIGALHLAEDLQTATETVWSILADGKCSSFPDVATTCGMLYTVLLRVTHRPDSRLSKACHQVLKADGQAVDHRELWG